MVDVGARKEDGEGTGDGGAATRKKGRRVCELGYCAIARRYRRRVILRLFPGSRLQRRSSRDSDTCDLAFLARELSSRFGNEVMERPILSFAT